MSDPTFDPSGVGPLHHHGPELFPVLDLIVGGGLPLAAALWLGRLRSVRARLAGGSGGTGRAIAVDGQRSGAGRSRRVRG